MQNLNPSTCACVNCPGASCTCGCQSPASTQQAAANCACGSTCACQAAAGACRCA